MNYSGVEFWSISFWFSKIHVITLFVLHILMSPMSTDSCHLWVPLFPLPHQLPFTLGPKEASGVGCPQRYQRAYCHAGLLIFISSKYFVTSLLNVTQVFFSCEKFQR